MSYLKDLRVVVRLALGAAFAGRSHALREVTALIQQEDRLPVLLLQPLQLCAVLTMDGGLR